MTESPGEDSLEELESQLSRLRPQPLSPALVDRIAGQLKEPKRLSLADRCLASFAAAGALAAAVIIGLLSWQALEDFSPGASPSMPIAVQHPPASIGEYHQALARSNDSALEFVH